MNWTRLDSRVPNRSQPSLDLSWLRSAWKSNLSLGAPASLESKVEAVGNGRGFVVITGQQVGLFGGPLYTLYKALTAIELARAIESRTGHVVLPVFWTVGDDSDFGEVSSSWFPNAQGRVQRVRDEDVPPGGTLVGRLPASRQRGLRDEVAAALDGLPYSEEVLRRIDSSLDRAETWAESQAAFLHSVLGSDSALVVDGGDRDLLSAGRPFLDSALDLPLEEDLKQGGDALRDAGLPVAFTPELARSSFVLRGATRTSIEDGYQAGDLLAPNVVLRPLLQDALLPNLSTIGGPSEIAYRRQLGPLYERLSVPEPIVTPRYRATLVPTLTSVTTASSALGATSNSARLPNHLPPNSSPDASPPGDESSLYALAVADPRAFVASAAEARRPESLRELLDQARSRVSHELEALGSSASEFDKNLKQVVESARGKIDYQFARIADESVKKARKQLAAENPALIGLEEFVLPKQKPQERVLSWWAPLATDGMDAVESLRRSVAEAVTSESESESGSESGNGSADELWQLLGLGPSLGKE